MTTRTSIPPTLARLCFVLAVVALAIAVMLIVFNDSDGSDPAPAQSTGTLIPGFQFIPADYSTLPGAQILEEKYEPVWIRRRIEQDDGTFTVGFDNPMYWPASEDEHPPHMVQYRSSGGKMRMKLGNITGYPGWTVVLEMWLAPTIEDVDWAFDEWFNHWRSVDLIPTSIHPLMDMVQMPDGSFTVPPRPATPAQADILDIGDRNLVPHWYTVGEPASGATFSRRNVIIKVSAYSAGGGTYDVLPLCQEIVDKLDAISPVTPAVFESMAPAPVNMMLGSFHLARSDRNGVPNITSVVSMNLPPDQVGFSFFAPRPASYLHLDDQTHPTTVQAGSTGNNMIRVWTAHKNLRITYEETHVLVTDD